MRFRIYMVNGRYYDVKEIPDFKKEALVRIYSIGEFDRVAYINKLHVVSIEQAIEEKTKPHEVEWQKKNDQYAKTTSKKNFRKLFIQKGIIKDAKGKN